MIPIKLRVSETASYTICRAEQQRISHNYLTAEDFQQERKRRGMVNLVLKMRQSIQM